EPVILVRPETKPEDVRGIAASVGILTTKGGMTSHAAVVARGLGKPAVVGAKDVKIDLDNELFKVNNLIVRKFDIITIDGSTGNIYLGRVPTIKPEIPPEVRKLLKWAKKYGKQVPSELRI
ncbi:pyruvate, phosphate dikinase, partial [archaeon]